MQLSRSRLIKHLNRITADGMISDAVLWPDFSSIAIHKSHTFLVDAPPLVGDADNLEGSDEEHLDEHVGLMQISTLRKALKKSKDGAPQVELEYNTKSKRIILHEALQTVSLVTASPETIPTRLVDDWTPDEEAKLRQAIMDDFSENGETFPIPENVASTFLDMQSLMGADSVDVDMTSSGAQLVVGAETGNYSRITWGGLEWPEEYRESYRADVMAAAFNRIDDFGEATITLLGPDDSMAVEYEGYTYVLSPRSK